MDSLALIQLITYICAILGGILLLLCIVLAAFFIYFQCIKLRRTHDSLLTSSNGQYVIVPTGVNRTIDVEQQKEGEKSLQIGKTIW